MSLLSKLFRKESPQLRKPRGETKTSGELISDVTEGANLVEGKQTWEYAEEKSMILSILKSVAMLNLRQCKRLDLYQHHIILSA